MRKLLLFGSFLVTLCLGCRTLSAAAGDELLADDHHSENQVPIPRSVRMDEPVPNVSGPHPRLLFPDAELASIKDTIHHDPILSRKYEALRHEGEKMLEAPPAEYVKDTEKALIASRLVLTRVGTLAGLYRLTGEEKFALRAKQEMLAAIAFKDWHPIDFLPTAELLNAEGLGYDWLYHYLTPEERLTIFHGIVNQGLLPARHAYKFHEDWTYSESNHNVVGNGGVAVAAIAIADEDSKLAKELIAATRSSLPPCMSQYAPDGAWPEGPIYWDYATRYACFYLSALDSGLHTDFGTSTYPGFAETGMFRIHSTGPTKKTFNFGDAEEEVHPCPFMYYLSRRFKKPCYAAHENYLDVPEANIFDLIWRAQCGPIEPFKTLAERTLPLDAVFRGVDVAFLRGDWQDPDATWIGFKGGTNKGSHRHLDLGSFVMDALGQRWALDLGADDYGLPGYSGSDKRWTYYRCSTEGHNTLTIGEPNQLTNGDSPMMAFHSGPDHSYAVADLTAAYSHAKRVMRGVELIDHRDIAIVDEVEMDGPSRITWNFHTKAKITVDGANATLELGGRTLRAQILVPDGAKFEVASANSPPPQTQQPDVSNLQVRLRTRLSHTRIIVLLSPEVGRVHDERIVRAEHGPPQFEPLKNWIDDSPIKQAR
jgi:hypothetical protein